MSRTIKHTELQPGDTFRLTQELTFVKHLNNGGLHASTKDQGDHLYLGKDFLSGEGTYVELLNRKLPTAAGSIVKVGPVSNPAVWMRVWNSHYCGWISEARVFMEDDEFEAFLQRNPRRNFEIILDRSEW